MMGGAASDARRNFPIADFTPGRKPEQTDRFGHSTGNYERPEDFPARFPTARAAQSLSLQITLICDTGATS